MSHRVNELAGCRLGLLLVCSLAYPGSALGLEPAVVELGCPELSAEEAAEVEARVRAGLLVSSVSASRVQLACTPDLATVTVETAEQRVVEQPTLAGADTRDVLLAAFERALGQLSPRASVNDAVPAEPSAPAPAPPTPADSTPTSESSAALPVSSVPPATQARQAPRVQQRGAERAEERAWAAELFMLGEVESWQGDLAFGAALGAAYGSRALAATFALGALAADPPGDSFGASELHAAVGLTYQPSWSLGVRAHLSFGGSLLLVRPRADTRPRGSTSVAAAVGEVQLSRPLWHGSWSLVPALGVRLFADERRVTLDDEPRLVIGKVAPRAALGVLHRFQ